MLLLAAAVVFLHACAHSCTVAAAAADRPCRSPNVNGAPCVVVPPSSGGFANGGSYVPQKVGTPAKCSCGSSSLNIDTFVPTCGDTSISSGLQPFTGCTAGRELNPSRGTLAPATDAVCCMVRKPAAVQTCHPARRSSSRCGPCCCWLTWTCLPVLRRCYTQAIGTPVVDFTLKKESWNAAMTAPLPGNQVAPSTPFTFKFTVSRTHVMVQAECRELATLLEHAMLTHNWAVQLPAAVRPDHQHREHSQQRSNHGDGRPAAHRQHTQDHIHRRF